jgi:DNA-directed RNA polymerase specialized sigma24 family protein
LEGEVLALFDRLQDRLLVYVLRFSPLTLQDGEEVVQDAFLVLFQHLRQGRSGANLNGWLFRVVHNLGLKRLQALRRGSRSIVVLSYSVEKTVADAGLNPEDMLGRGPNPAAIAGRRERFARAGSALPGLARGRAEVSRNRGSFGYFFGGGSQVAGALPGANRTCCPAMKKGSSQEVGR